MTNTLPLLATVSLTDIEAFQVLSRTLTPAKAKDAFSALDTYLKTETGCPIGVAFNVGRAVLSVHGLGPYGLGIWLTGQSNDVAEIIRKASIDFGSVEFEGLPDA